MTSIQFNYSNLVPFMDSNHKTDVLTFACREQLHFSGSPRAKNWQYHEHYIFNKDSKTSKPIQYNFSHVKVSLRCQRVLANGSLCSREIDEGCYCNQHYKMHLNGRIDKEQHEFEDFNHQLAIAQLKHLKIL